MRPRRQRKLPRLARIVLSVLAGLIGLVGLLVASAYVIVHTDWGREQVRVRVEKGLRDVFIGKVTIRRVEGDVLGNVVLRDLEIDDADGKPALRVASLHIEFALLPFLGHSIKVKSVIADGVRVDGHTLPDGKLSLAGLLKPPKQRKPPAWNVDIEQLKMTRSAIALALPDQDLHLDDLEADGALHIDNRGGLKARAGLGGHWRERGLPVAASAELESIRGQPTLVPAVHVAVGGIEVAARAVSIDGQRIDGHATLVAPAGTVRKLVARSPIAEDLFLTIMVHPTDDAGQSGATRVVVRGALGKAPIDADVTFAPATRHVSGIVHTHRLDARAFDPQAVATLVTATLAVDATVEDGAIVLTRAHVLADAHVGGATRADAHVDLTASGRVATAKDAPADATRVTLRGQVIGRDIVHGVTRAKVASLDIDASGLPARPLGHAHLQASGIVDQGRPVGMLVVDARSRPDRRIAVRARSLPASGPWIVDVDALVGIEPELVSIVLAQHRVRTRGVDFVGQGGTIDIRPERVDVRGLRTSVAHGGIAVDATYVKAGARKGDLDASVAADHLDLAEVDRSFGVAARLGPEFALAGVIDARASVSARRGSWTGSLGGRATGLAVRKDVTPIDASLEARLGPDALAIEATVRGKGVGGFTASIDIDPPRRLTDARAWRQLPRSDVRRGHVILENLDLAALARLVGRPPPATGRFDGELTLTGSETDGVLHARGIETAKITTPIDADLSIHRSGIGLATITLGVTLREVTTAHAVAIIEVPARPFDFAEWAAFDADEIKGITVKVEDFVLDERRSILLGLNSTWHGRAGMLVQVEPSLTGATATIDVTGLRGGPLARPADVHLDAKLDGEQFVVRGSGVIDGRPVLSLEGHAPVGVPALFKGGLAVVKAAPVVGRLRIDQLPLTALGAGGAVGDTTPFSGTLNARAMIMGTVAAPTGRASVVVANAGGGDGRPVLHELRLDGSYDGTLVHAQIHGQQSDGGKLDSMVDFEAAHPAAVKATLVASRFDLAPLEHLAPVRLLGIAGVIDAKLSVQGAEGATTQFDGQLKVTGARVPLAGTVGTLRHATLEISAHGGVLLVKVEGEIGSGRLGLTARAQLEGLDPRNAEADLVIDRITLINQLQPRIAGKLNVKVHKQGELWHVDATVRNASVVVPEDKGRNLYDTGPPSDMVFIENGRPPPARAEPRGLRVAIGQRPARPFLVAQIDIGPTSAQSKEFRGQVRGNMTITLGEDGLAIDGLIQVVRGEVDLFDRRYRIERANVRFDGGVDPSLDLRLAHEFPQLTLYADVRGRVSKPELELSSEPGTYSEGQLLSFLLGGTPGADPGQEVQSAATGVASTLLSKKLGGYVEKVLPVELDVLRFEASTASSSAAVTIGKWLTRKLFLAYRRRLEARADENAGEAELEFWLGRNVLIEATAGDRGYHGADLLWLKRW